MVYVLVSKGWGVVCCLVHSDNTRVDAPGFVDYGTIATGILAMNQP